MWSVCTSDGSGLRVRGTEAGQHASKEVDFHLGLAETVHCRLTCFRTQCAFVLVTEPDPNRLLNTSVVSMETAGDQINTNNGRLLTSDFFTHNGRILIPNNLLIYFRFSPPHRTSFSTGSKPAPLRGNVKHHQQAL